MVPIAEKIDQVGFFSLEVWGGATFDSCIRYLNEDPWERLRTLRRHVKKTKLQMLLRGQNVVGYRNYPDDVVIKFVEKAYENGIDIFRVFDALNDLRNLQTAIKTVKKVGAHAQGTICYTISPVHTVEYYVETAKGLAEMECDSICIKDMAGMLAPEPAYKLVTAIKEKVGLPVHLHCHSTSGMAMMTYLRACQADVDIIDTAFSPLAWGTSVSYTHLRAHETRHDIVCRLISPLAERVDPSILVHQIPGGMFSNLIAQLKEQNALHRLREVLEEVPRVREELGYPPLVTPTSQLVGIQAVFNVLSGERYKIVPKEVKDYVKGFYGKPPAPIKEEIRKKIIGDEQPITCRPADLLEPALDKIPEEAKRYIKSEEDMLTYALFPAPALEFFKKRLRKRKEKAVPPEERTELEQAAAVSAAIALYVTSLGQVKAVIPKRGRSGLSPWVLAGRRSLMERRSS